MLRHSFRGLAVAAVAAYIFAPAPAAAVTLVDSCRPLDKAGETYILTADLSTSGDCFRLLADRITIDLGGHTIDGQGGSGSGVWDSGVARTLTVVKNGTIKNFAFGILLNLSSRATVRAVDASDNSELGIVVGESSLVKDCTVQRNGGNGIATADGVQVEGCVIGGPGGNGNGGHGVTGGTRMLVTRNTAIGNGLSGISVGDNSTVTHNTANNNTGDSAFPGISSADRSLVNSNTANNNGTDGMAVGVGSTVTFNTANDNSRDGIVVTCRSTVTNNTATGNGGLDFNLLDFGGGPCVAKNNVSP